APARGEATDPPASPRRAGAPWVAWRPMGTRGDDAEILRRARAVLDAHWDEARGHTYPHVSKYPHQWLWDLSFAAICWPQGGEPQRAGRELAGVLSAQFADGFVPHMRYASRNHERGPLDHCSSYTQPPIYAHAARILAQAGPLGCGLTDRIAAS